MPTIVYSPAEIGHLSTLVRVGLAATSLTVEIPRHLRHAVPEPHQHGYYPWERGHALYIMHDPESTLGWGNSLHQGFRIKATVVREHVRGLLQGRASNLTFPMGKPHRVEVSNNRMDIWLERDALTTKMPNADFRHAPNWPDQVVVRDMWNGKHPAELAGMPDFTLPHAPPPPVLQPAPHVAPVVSSPPPKDQAQSEYMVRLALVHKTTGNPDVLQDVVLAYSPEEALGYMMLERGLMKPDYAVAGNSVHAVTPHTPRVRR